MENTEKKKPNTGALIGAIAAIVLCGLSGLCFLLPFSIATFFNVASFNDTTIPWGWGFLFLCGALLFIAIGVVVPIVLLKKKKKKKEPEAVVIPPSEPLPPAS